MPVFISLLQRLRKNRRWKAQGGKKKKNEERFCASLIEGWRDSIKGWLKKMKVCVHMFLEGIKCAEYAEMYRFFSLIQVHINISGLRNLISF